MRRKILIPERAIVGDNAGTRLEQTSENVGIPRLPDPRTPPDRHGFNLSPIILGLPSLATRIGRNWPAPPGGRDGATGTF